MHNKRRVRERRKITDWVAFFFSLLIPSFLSLVGLFLSLWIVVPAPVFALLPLGVGAPEVSPWLILLNTIAALLTFKGIRRAWIYRIAFTCSLIALALSVLPLVQFPATNQRAIAAIHSTLGKDYLTAIPQAQRAAMRSSPLALWDVFRGIPTSDVRYTPDIQFANPNGIPLKLNLYQPLQRGKYPTIVSIYGGAWRSGSPNDNEQFNRYMAARGYTVVAIDYRHAPQFQFPAQLVDVQTALTFIRQHAADYEIDVDRMALMGRSAGGHLAMLAAYPPDAMPVRAVVNYYSPVDLTAGYNAPPNPDPINSRAVLRAFLGGTPAELPNVYQLASPISYVTRPLPITLLIYGGRDHLVQSKYGRALYERLRAVESPASFIEIPWAEHAFDAVFNGVSNQLALYYTERFLAWALR